jgi:hypothetical protein
VYDLYNDTDDIAEILAGPITKRIATTAGAQAKRRKTEPTHKKYYTARWKDTILPLSAIHAYTSMGYHPKQVLKITNLYGTGIDRHFRRVVWEPSDIAAATIPRLPSGPMAVKRYEQNKTLPKAQKSAYATPRDAHLTPEQRQGRWDPPPTDLANRARSIRANTTFECTPSDPYTDTHPTGRYHIQLGVRNRDGGVTNATTAHVYDPRGRCVGTLDMERLEILRTRYEHTKLTLPETHHNLSANGDFAEDTARLLLRYNRDPKGKATKGAPRSQATTDPA